MPKKNQQPERLATFIESMECLPVPTVPEGPEWTYEISSMDTGSKSSAVPARRHSSLAERTS